MKGSIKLLIFSLALMVLHYVWHIAGGSGVIHPSMPWIVVFFWLQSSAIYLLLDVLEQTWEMNFSILLVAGFTFRLLSALIAVVIVVTMIGVRQHELYILNFFAIYLLYLVFEIVTGYAKLAARLKQG